MFDVTLLDLMGQPMSALRVRKALFPGSWVSMWLVTDAPYDRDTEPDLVVPAHRVHEIRRIT